MNNPSPELFAKLLLDLVVWIEPISTVPGVLIWAVGGRKGANALESEYLHLCYLAELRLGADSGKQEEEYIQHEKYALALLRIVGTWRPTDFDGACDADFYAIARATWQQRLAALCEVRGIKI